MNLVTMPLGSYQTNCYLVWGENSDTCVVIDPGFEPETVLLKCKQLGKKIEAILLTHGHFDHVGAVKDLAADTDCRVFLCAEDTMLPPMLTDGPLYYTDTYADGTILNIAGLYIRILHTPGHTPGGVCLLVDDVIFSGDTLFAGGCGRSDLGGDWATLVKSLKRLSQIEGYFKVFPGHGESTTLAYEKRYNPYMR